MDDNHRILRINSKEAYRSFGETDFGSDGEWGEDNFVMFSNASSTYIFFKTLSLCTVRYANETDIMTTACSLQK